LLGQAFRSVLSCARSSTVRAEEAVVSDREKAFGPHLVEDAADELCGGKRQVFPSVAAALLEAARDVPVFERFHAVVGESHPADVGGEGGEDRMAGSGRFTVDHPCLLPELGRDVLDQTGVGQGLLERAAEAFGARADGNQPSLIVGGEPRRSVRRQGPNQARDHG